MTEDPREFGLTAADLRDAADRLYEPGDDRLDRIDWTHDTQVRYGQIRSRLRSLADAIDRPPCEHARPDPADMRASLATARAVLAADPDAAHTAAESGSCAACTTTASIQFGFALVATFGGEQMFVSEQLRQRLLAAVADAQHELDAAPN
jgi:hypothetical protein